MEEIASKQVGEHVEGGESSNPVDPFEAVMGKEHNGRLRLYGRGVTASTLGKEVKDHWATEYCQTMAHQLKQLHPQLDINAEALRRLATATQSPGDA
ncbi:hypothetical protein Dimus_010620 [Dionaea muscipula]